MGDDDDDTDDDDTDDDGLIRLSHLIHLPLLSSLCDHIFRL